MALDAYEHSPMKRSRHASPAGDSLSDDNRHEERDVDGGRYKRRRPSKPDRPAPSPLVEVQYRILCPLGKIGAVLGQGGSIVKSLRQDTKAKIRVEDRVSGADERIIHISSPPEQTVSGRERSGSRSLSDSSSRSTSRDRGHRYDMLCPAQDALFRIHSRITEGTESDAEGYGDDGRAYTVQARLLVPDSQIGCIIGRGGNVIEEMRKDTGCQIRVLPKVNLPACALQSDDLVQLLGTPALVRKALFAISTKLYENPPRVRARGPPVYAQVGSNVYSSASLSRGSAGRHEQSASEIEYAPAPRYGHSRGGSEGDLIVCILCPIENVGAIIGKGGNLVRRLRDDSGAKIKVCDQVGDSHERVIEVSAIEHPDNRVSPVIEAVLQIQKRLGEVFLERESRNGIVTIRLLIRSSQLGCILGRGGQVITEIRKSSKANIRIPSKDELPLCADTGTELVQVSGEPRNVESAILQILNRLRNDVFKGSRASASTYGGHADPVSPRRPYSQSGDDYGNYSVSPHGARSLRDSRRREI